MDKEYNMLELSTQILIKEAINRHIAVDVLDEKENLIRLKKGNKIEYIQQATKTSADNYIVPLLMENKQVTKLLLKEQSINVPYGIIIESIDQGIDEYSSFENMDIVVKPNSTNFGKGVSILDKNRAFDHYKDAIEEAFSFDSTVIVEYFFTGKEFRFLVIKDEVVAILHRIPANILGDGEHTIEQLVEIKNQSPLRGKGYKTPLEKIELGKVEMSYIEKKGLNKHSIPGKEELVYLRENSNVSTGGDSIDYTDDLHPGYKEIALKAAKGLGAMICGIDIMLSDFRAKPTKDNYTIIELNFNPALHMHNYPYQGKNRHVEKKVLDLLGFFEDSTPT